MLSPNILFFLSVFMMLMGFVLQLRTLTDPPVPHQTQLWYITTILASLSHAGLLHIWIDLPQGQNLSLPNLLSLMAWLSVTVMLLSSIRQPLRNLSLFLFPLSLLSLFYGYLQPSIAIQQVNSSPYFLHVWLGVLTFSLLVNAAFQAILCVIEDKLLRTHRFHRLLRCFPALEVMEKLFFKMLWMSFIFLSILFVSSLFYFKGLFTWPLIQKTLLTGLIWISLLIVLIGHRLYGWRRLAIYWVVVSVLLVVGMYFLLWY